MDNNLEVTRDKDHLYWSNGVQIPGYSAIIKDLGISAPGAAFYTKEGSDIGTVIHEWLLFLAKKQEPADPPEDRIAGKVDAIRKFLDDTGFILIDGEKPRKEPTLNYACTPDIWGTIGADVWDIDLKSGGKVNSHPLQTAAQSLALRANMVNCTHRGSLYVKANGKYTLEEHIDRSDFDAWRTIVASYHFKRRYL